MKTAIKVFVSVLIIGIVVALIGLIIIDFDVKALVLSDEDYTLKEGEVESMIDYIDIDVSNRIITFVKSTKEKISYTYYEADEDKLNIKERNNSLIMDSKEVARNKWFNFSFPSTKVRTVTIALPITFEGEIQAYSTNGSIKGYDLGTLERVNLSTTNSTISLRKISIKQESNFISTNGKITLENVSCYENIGIETTNGAITLKDVLASKIEAESTNGRVYCTSIESGSIDIRTTNSRISCVDIKSSIINANTTNGNIDIEIVGDYEHYEATVRTTHGNIIVDGTKVASQVLNKGQTKKVRAKTTNGSIKIDFI